MFCFFFLVNFAFSPIDGLPTQLSEKQFAQRYDAVGSAAYNRVLADIEARIDALPLWR